MAHQSNIIQVKKTFKSDSEETVTDPVCGKTLKRTESKNLLAHEDRVYYFCSKGCQLRFLSYPVELSGGQKAS